MSSPAPRAAQAEAMPYRREPGAFNLDDYKSTMDIVTAWIEHTDSCVSIGTDDECNCKFGRCCADAIDALVFDAVAAERARIAAAFFAYANSDACWDVRAYTQTAIAISDNALPIAGTARTVAPVWAEYVASIRDELRSRPVAAGSAKQVEETQ